MRDDKTIEFNRLLRSFIFMSRDDIFEKSYFFNLVSEFISEIDEMKSNPDTRFIEKMKKIKFPYDDDLRINSIFLRLFGIIKGYEYHRDNYENFEALVDDLAISSCLILPSFPIDIFHASCKIIDEILSNKNYKELLGHRKFLSDMCISFGQEHVLNFIKIYNERLVVFKDANDLDIYENYVRNIFDRLLFPVNYINSSSYFCKEQFYDKILLYGDRFEYLNDRLQAIEKNYFIKKDIFSIVRKFSIGLFNELNVDSVNDSFKTCMNCVFDSDSYLELRNKLNLLVEASNLYESGKKENAFSLVKKINDSNLKRKYKGKIVCYSSNTMNKNSKPDTILEREFNLCSKIGHVNVYDVGDIVLYSRSLDDAIKWFRCAGNPLFSPLNKIKCKLMKNR